MRGKAARHVEMLTPVTPDILVPQSHPSPGSTSWWMRPHPHNRHTPTATRRGRRWRRWSSGPLGHLRAAYDRHPTVAGHVGSNFRCGHAHPGACAHDVHGATGPAHARSVANGSCNRHNCCNAGSDGNPGAHRCPDAHAWRRPNAGYPGDARPKRRIVHLGFRHHRRRGLADRRPPLRSVATVTRADPVRTSKPATFLKARWPAIDLNTEVSNSENRPFP
jgi:hypothetical protein